MLLRSRLVFVVSEAVAWQVRGIDVHEVSPEGHAAECGGSGGRFAITSRLIPRRSIDAGFRDSRSTDVAVSGVASRYKAEVILEPLDCVREKHESTDGSAVRYGGGIQIEADGVSCWPLGFGDRPAAPKRLDVHIVFGHLADDPLPDTAPALGSCEIAHPGSVAGISGMVKLGALAEASGTRGKNSASQSGGTAVGRPA